MIDKLTPEQEAKIPEYLERFRAIGLSTERGNEEVASKAIADMAELLGNPRPQKFYWTESPIAAIKKACELTGTQINQFEYYKASFGSFEAYWLSFYTFINEELDVKKAKGIDTALDIIKNTGYYICFDDFVVASHKPVAMHFNDREQLHNPEGAALEYADGFGVYMLNGVRIEKEMLNYGPEQILAVTNAEQRLVLIQNYGIENMLQPLGAVTKDTFEEYELIEVTLEGERNKLLKMRNPSEPKDHYEFVPPEIKTCKQAMAWRVGLDLYTNPAFKA